MSRGYAQSMGDQAAPQNNVAESDTIAPVDDLGLDYPVDYQAKDSTLVDVLNERILLFGKARVVYGSMEVTGDFIAFSLADYTAHAVGKRDSLGQIVERATFKEGDTEFKEDSLAYNFKTRRGISYGVRTEQGEAHLLSQVSKKSANNWISVGKGKLTTCNAENPHYHFQLTKAMVIPNEKVVSGPLYLKFRKIPTPLALPFGFFPNKQESVQGVLLPGYGNANEKGFFIQNLGYYLPVNQYLDTKFLFDVYTRGSWAIRNVTGYKKLYKYTGNFNISRVVNVNGIPELPSYGKTVNFNIQWNHTQDPKARPNSTFSSSVNMGSLNNFRNNLNTSQTDFLSSTFSSRIQWTKRWPDSPFNMGLTAGHTQNTQSRNVQVTLPTANLNMSRITLGRLAQRNLRAKRALDNIGLTASADFSNSVSENERMYSLNKLDSLWASSRNGLRLQAQTSTTLRAKQYGTLSLSVNSTLTNTFKYIGTSDLTRLDTLYGLRSALNWNASANFNSRLYGTFNFGNRSALKAIRHMVQWNIGMSYSPNVNTQKGMYTPTGEFIGYNPFDVAAFAPQNSVEQLNVNWSSTNNLEAKVRDRSSAKVTYKKIKLIESWKKSLSWNTLADSLQLSNLSMSAFTTIAGKVNLNYNSTYSFYDRDSLGREVNRYLLDSRNRLMRMEGTNLALGFQLKSKNKNQSTTGAAAPSAAESELIVKNGDNLIDFSVPWSLNVNYNFRISQVWNSLSRRDSLVFKQALTFSGDVTLFKHWAISFNSGYDMSNARYQQLQPSDFGLRDFTTTNIGLHWDLHCWEFSMNYVPFGQRQSYMMQLNIKSALLQDLKIQKRGNLGDPGYLY
jgi:LptD protein